MKKTSFKFAKADLFWIATGAVVVWLFMKNTPCAAMGACLGHGRDRLTRRNRFLAGISTLPGTMTPRI